jgi:hypothetical protein
MAIAGDQFAACLPSHSSNCFISRYCATTISSASFWILAALNDGFCHVNRCLMVRDHAAHEIDVGFAGICCAAIAACILSIAAL